MRSSWNNYFMDIAHTVAGRASCPRASVGAVIVKDKRILTTGYNGAPPGVCTCIECGCLIDNGHCIRSIHAEVNAVLQAAIHGVSIKGGKVFCTHEPCFNCTKLLCAAGITEIVYQKEYTNAELREQRSILPIKVISLDKSGNL